MNHRAQSLTKAKSEISRTDLFLELLSLQMQIYSSLAIRILWNRELNALSYLQRRNLFKGTLNRIDYPKVALYAPDRGTGLIIRAEVYDRRRFRAACAQIRGLLRILNNAALATRMRYGRNMWGIFQTGGNYDRTHCAT